MEVFEIAWLHFPPIHASPIQQELESPHLLGYNIVEADGQLTATIVTLKPEKERFKSTFWYLDVEEIVEEILKISHDKSSSYL